ncbi:hypothetical protein AB204_18115 [Xenorhabdus khoisanae]|uniref:Uncharacterized protein n=1 Tax=Xenorhabdus khoisanae TaxID=880157 RepID=A0A0J5FN94_9GAMM|nr:hypothetical protein AB204_18115 [Xenorhabdus khoisanae]
MIRRNLDPAKYESKAVKFNLMMPDNLLTAIDCYIEPRNAAFLQAAIKLSGTDLGQVSKGNRT